MGKFNIRNFLNKDIENIKKCWNEEVGFIYPIDDTLFDQCITNNKYFDLSSSYVVYDGDKLIGFILGKVYDNDPIIPTYFDWGWISLFFISRKYRKLGLGTTLLNKLEESMKKKNIKTIRVGADLDNFFPGIPNDFDNLTDVFFKNHGYELNGYTHDMVKKLDKNDLELFKNYNNNCYIDEDGNKKNVTIRYATINDKEKTLEFFKRCFFGRWNWEATVYFNDNEIKKEYLIALVDDKVVGFLRVNNGLINKKSYNINWSHRFDKLCGFGPLGVDPSYRKHGIAKMLFYYGIYDTCINNYTDLMIDWTGLVTYYQQFGFEIFKCYQFCKKNL